MISYCLLNAYRYFMSSQIDMDEIGMNDFFSDSFDVDSMSERSGDPKMRYLVKLLHHLAMLLLDKE